MKKILILGDSHTRAMSRALEVNHGGFLRSEEACFDINWLQTVKGEKVRGDLPIESAIEKISNLSNDDIVVISIYGTAHNIFGLLQHEQAYDIFDPADERSNLKSEITLLPEQVIRSEFDGIFRRGKVVPRLRAAANCRVYHLSVPPPKQDDQFIRERTVMYRGQALATTPINPAPLRRRLWDLEMRALQDYCAEIGVSFVAPPKKAMCPSGFLAPQFYANDATHANAAYGELVLQQLETIAGGTTASEEASR